MIYDDLDYLVEDYNLQQVLDEAYKGKTKALQELEKMIGDNRKKYLGSFKIGGGYYADKDLVKIGDKIASIFNFKVVDFNIVNDPAINAFTVPAGFSMASVNMRDLIKTDDKEMKFKNGTLSAFIRVTSGLWTNPTFTDGEITAIIIHEVGHNFQHEVNSGLRIYAINMLFLRLFQSILLICTGNIIGGVNSFIKSDSEMRGEINRWAKNDPLLSGAVNFFGGIMGFIKFILYEVSELSVRLTLGIPAGAKNIAAILINAASDPVGTLLKVLIAPMRKGGENISDTWASDHGYGPELVSALAKMQVEPNASSTEIGKLCMKLPVLDSICTLFALPSMIVSQLFADHPVTGKRASNIVRDLEGQIDNDNITPAMKKEIKKQIKEVKDTIDMYSRVDNPLQGTALRRAILKFTTNYDRDPRGFAARNFSKRDLIESVRLAAEIDEVNFLNETLELNDFLDD